MDECLPRLGPARVETNRGMVPIVMAPSDATGYGSGRRGAVECAEGFRGARPWARASRARGARTLDGATQVRRSSVRSGVGRPIGAGHRGAGRGPDPDSVAEA